MKLSRKKVDAAVTSIVVCVAVVSLQSLNSSRDQSKGVRSRRIRATARLPPIDLRHGGDSMTWRHLLAAMTVLATMVSCSTTEQMSDEELKTEFDELWYDAAIISRNGYAEILKGVDSGDYGVDVESTSIRHDDARVQEVCLKLIERELKMFNRLEGTNHERSAPLYGALREYYAAINFAWVYSFYGALIQEDMIEEIAPFPEPELAKSDYQKVRDMYEESTIKSQGLLNGLPASLVFDEVVLTIKSELVYCTEGHRREFFRERIGVPETLPDNPASTISPVPSD